MPPAYLLDTDHCIAFLNPSSPNHAKVAARINATPVTDLRLSAFTALELAEGPFHSPTPQGRQSAQAANDALFAAILLVDITPVAVQEFGRIRAELRQKGQIIGDMDIGIAATALAYGLTLVTHNTKDFARIPGLTLDDWT